MNFNSAIEIIAKAGGLIAFVGSLVKGYDYIAKKVKTARKDRNDFYCRPWGNQGLYKTPPSHYIDINIWLSDDHLKGRYGVRNSIDENSWVHYELSAKRRLGHLKCVISSIEENKMVVAALGTLTKKKNRLRWKLVEGGGGKFPATAILNMALPNVM